MTARTREDLLSEAAAFQWNAGNLYHHARHFHAIAVTLPKDNPERRRLLRDAEDCQVLAAQDAADARFLYREAEEVSA